MNAILVELDYKGSYRRFALTPEEFAKEYPETYQTFGPIDEANSDTLRHMVHIWFAPCKVMDQKWQVFFTDMASELPESDVRSGNLAYVDEGEFGELKRFLKINGTTELVSGRKYFVKTAIPY